MNTILEKIVRKVTEKTGNGNLYKKNQLKFIHHQKHYFTQ